MTHYFHRSLLQGEGEIRALCEEIIRPTRCTPGWFDGTVKPVNCPECLRQHDARRPAPSEGRQRPCAHDRYGCVWFNLVKIEQKDVALAKMRSRKHWDPTLAPLELDSK